MGKVKQVDRKLFNWLVSEAKQNQEKEIVFDVSESPLYFHTIYDIEIHENKIIVNLCKK